MDESGDGELKYKEVINGIKTITGEQIDDQLA